MTNLLSKALIVFATCATFGLSAAAADGDSGSSSMKKPNMFTSEFQPHIGLLAGVTSPEGDGDSEAELGVDIGYQPKAPYSLGAEFSHVRFGNNDVNADRDTLLLKAGYNFGGDMALIKYSWIGVGAGAVFDEDDTRAVLTPMVGFDIPVTRTDTEFITLGANARYSIISEVDDTFTVNGAVKYWY